MVYAGKSMEKCLNVLSGPPWKLIAKGHSCKPCDGAVSYQSLGAGPKFDSRLIKVRFVVEKGGTGLGLTLSVLFH